MAEAVGVPRLENEQVRVTEWQFAPGAATGLHRHEYDYVIVPLTTGVLHLSGPAGESKTELSPGVSYFRKAGVEHNVVNGGEAYLAFVEVELKDYPG